MTSLLPFENCLTGLRNALFAMRLSHRISTESENLTQLPSCSVKFADFALIRYLGKQYREKNSDETRFLSVELQKLSKFGKQQKILFY